MLIESAGRLLEFQLMAKQRSEVTELVRKVETEGTGYNYSSLIGFHCPLEEGHMLGGQGTVG